MENYYEEYARLEWAVLRRDNGQLVDKYPTKESADKMTSNAPEYLETAYVANASKLEACYVEMAGPNGYGCNIPEFTTYGGIKRCIINFIKWAIESAKTFGPDARDIADYYRNLRIYVNGESHSDWWYENYPKLVEKYGKIQKVA